MSSHGVNVALTHCCECGVALADPVTEDQALDDFLALEDASYACESCANALGLPERTA